MMTLIGKSLLKRGHLLVELRPMCCLGDWKAVVHILKQHDYMSMFPSSGSSTGNNADVIADAGFDELDRMMRTALNSMAMSIYYLVLTENGACRKGGGSTAEEGIDVSKINVRLDKQRIEEASELFQLHHPPLLDAADVELTKESTYASKYTRATEKAALILFSLRESLSEGDWESVRVKLSSERAAIESDVREERPELEEMNLIRRENLRRQVVASLTLSLGKGGPTIMDSPTSRSTPLDSIQLSSIDVVGLDQGLELASRMDREGDNSSHNGPTEVSKLVSAADIVRRLRVAMRAVHESSLSSRALWNNVKHGLERAREEGWLVRSTSASSDSSFASSDDLGATSGDALIAARSELRLVSDIVHDRQAQISLLEHLSNGSVPSLESVERTNSGGSENASASGAGVAGGSAGASVLPLLREALEETRRRFPNGAKSTLVRNLLSISEIFYNLRRSFYDSDFQELHSRVGSFVAAGGIAALGAAQGTVGKNLERELIMLKEHDDNHVLLETMSGALRAPGSLCRRSESVGSLVRWIFISSFIYFFYLCFLFFISTTTK